MKWRIQDAIGSSSSDNVLFEMLPNLQAWMAGGNQSDTKTSSSSVDPSTRDVKGFGSSLRLKFMFCKLIGAVASRALPLVLILDDLQWADDMTVRKERKCLLRLFSFEGRTLSLIVHLTMLSTLVS